MKNSKYYGHKKFPVLRVFNSTQEADEWLKEEIRPYVSKGWEQKDVVKCFVDDEIMPLFQVENLEDMCFYRMYIYGAVIYDPETHLREEYDKDNDKYCNVGYLNYKGIYCLVRGGEI